MISQFLKSLFSDLSEYDIPPCPVYRRVEKAIDPDQDGEVINGRLWKTTVSKDGLESERVVSSTPGLRLTTLTGWDVAYLNEHHKNPKTDQATWKRNIADILKKEWATELEDGDYPSAEKVVRMHTATGHKKPQAGYSLSNVKKYHHAFNDALLRETEEMTAK